MKWKDAPVRADDADAIDEIDEIDEINAIDPMSDGGAGRLRDLTALLEAVAIDPTLLAPLTEDERIRLRSAAA